jgi:electron transport complex protein RnfC
MEMREHPGGSFVPCIVIDNDHREEWAETVQPAKDPANLTSEELRTIILEAGIVGKGGATFPSHVKYAPVEGKKVETVILNGVECEPYLTTDHRLMLERSEKIVAGLGYILRAVGCQQGIIGIEENKMDAVAVMEQAVAARPHIRIVVLKEKYPQGSEKQLIYACTGKEVPVGGLPLAVGVIVNNVGTAAAIADAVELGIPFIERNVTVSGPGICQPANYRVRIGTLFSELIQQSGGTRGEVEKIIAGGPMMGKTVFTAELPVVKGTSGIVLLPKEAAHPREYPCVRCATCIDACPSFIEPTTLARLAKRRAWEEAEQGDVMNCIECSSCVYVCPAQIPLIQHIRRAKQAILAAKAR